MVLQEVDVSQGIDVAVVGATGLVGEVLIGILAEREFPVGRLRLLASERSSARRMSFRQRSLDVEVLSPEALSDSDLVFFGATGQLSRELAPQAAAAGAIVIDKSSTWRMDESVPLVVPELNADALGAQSSIIACPNCTTIAFVLALAPLAQLAGLARVVVVTFQAASGAGRAGLDELLHPPAGRTESMVFPAPLAGNIIPLCESPRGDGYTSEEIKLRDETRKILGLPRLDVSMTCVRVPVAIGHSAAILIETERAIDAARARLALAAQPGVRVLDDPDNGAFPTPLQAAGQDEVLVGRIRSDLGGDPRRLWLFQSSDNLRKGAATNAVQIAEAMIARGFLRAGGRHERQSRIAR